MNRIAILTACLLACAPLPASDQVPVDPTLEFEELVTGLTFPTAMTFIGPNDLLIAQKDDGRVLRVIDGVLQPGEVLDVHVDYYSLQGLLGVLADPDFINNRYVYVYYTESSIGQDTNANNAVVAPLGNRLYRYRWDGSALVGPKLILDLPTGNGPHNGAVMRFGPDDKLYMIFGDSSFNGKLQNVPDGLDPNDSGVVFRINPDGSALTDNPFYDVSDPSNPLNRYFAYGIRNSFGMGFDPVTGRMWASENGPVGYDEINLVEPGMNGGHSQISGPDERDPEGVEDLWMLPGAFYSDPKLSWLVATAPTTVAFVESPKLGCDNLHDLLVGAFSCRVIYRFDLDEERKNLVLEAPGLEDLVADNEPEKCSNEQEGLLFAVGPQFNSDSTTALETGQDGLLYLLSYNQGTLRRMGPVPGAIDDGDTDQVDDDCDCAQGDPTAYAEPFEVPWVRLSGGATTKLGWDPQNGPTGSGTTSTVVTGRISALHDNLGFEGACKMETGLTTPATTDARPLPPNEGFYYLVEAANACGNGGYGAGVGRDALETEPPPDCP